MSTISILETAGPVVSPVNSAYVAYVLRGLYHGEQYIVCLMTFNEKKQEELITKNFSALFEFILNYAQRNLAEWNRIPVYLGILQYSNLEGKSVQSSVYAYQMTETSLRIIAEKLLSQVVEISSGDFGDRKVTLEKITDTPLPGFRTIVVQPEGEETSFAVHAREGTEIDWLGEMLPDLDAMHIRMYLEETVTYIKLGQPLFAFRSFYYFLLLSNNRFEQDITDICELGLALVFNLMQHQMFDYAEWVAIEVAKISENAQLHNLAVRALRFAGQTTENLGRIQETKTHYERALSHLSQVTDSRLKAQLHMSYGISLIVHLSHYETEEQLPAIWETNKREILSVAQDQFESALKEFAQFDDESSHWSRSAIQLDLLRIEDLLGKHEEALKKLNDLTKSDRFVSDVRLVLTANLYQLKMLKKLADADGSWAERYYVALQEANSVFATYVSPFAVNNCIFYTLLGDAFLKRDEIKLAIECYQFAFTHQLDFARNHIQPPRPNAMYGGWLIIDLCGKLQQALLKLAEKEQSSGDIPAPTLQAFLMTDIVKGRFFQRDLGYLVSDPVSQLGTFLSRREEELRKNIVHSTSDHRILAADYEWFVQRDVSREDAEAVKTIKDLGTPMTSEDVERILTNDSDSMALVSFYAMNRQTFVYIVDRTVKPKTLILEISLDRLQEIIRHLYVGISGDLIHPRINPKKPDLHQKFFKPLFELQSLFKPLLDYLADIDLILLCPHGIWHNLPLHALILPLFWEQGRLPGLVYVPSVRVLELLKKRDLAGRPFRYKNIALTTAYTREDPEPLFAKAHQDLAEVLDQTEGEVLSAFGGKATVQRFLDDTLKVDIHHILAHGKYGGHIDPLKSSILLADQASIPSKKLVGLEKIDDPHLVSGLTIMANGTRANHITVQACSLGQSQSTYGDEFWGFSRALIAGGANSVLAPLWDINSVSSTRLIALFYKNWLIKRRPKWQAWSEAQYALYKGQEQDEWTHFYHWAAFRLLGV